MLELSATTHRRKISLDPEIRSRFNHPIIFYLAHQYDSRAFFITFVILDFEKSELVFISSYYPENVEKTETHPEQRKFRLLHPAFNPHCTLQINPDESFLTFVENGYYFYHVNYKKNIIRVHTGKDLPCLEKDQITEFGSTFFRDDQDRNFFYLTAISADREKNEYLLNFYKSNFDFSSFEKIFTMPSEMFNAPHVTRKFKKHLLNSEFLKRVHKNDRTDKVYDNALDYMKFVYEDLYGEYCQKMNKAFDKNEFYSSNKINYGRIELSPDFSAFCAARGSNFLAICKKNSRYSFSMLPGTVTSLNLEKKTLQSAQTTFCAPAHFEIDEKNGHVFTSSHNFVIFDKTYFVGPAAIDKFAVKDGELEKRGTFTNEKAYRFTTHRVFRYKNKSYVCSFGQPNRLYFIDGDSMELLYFDDIGEDVLSNREDVCDFLNSEHLENSAVLKTIEVSPDGAVLFLLGHDYVYFYSFPERKIISKLDYRSFELDESLFLDQFYKRTTHTNFLD